MAQSRAQERPRRRVSPEFEKYFRRSGNNPPLAVFALFSALLLSPSPNALLPRAGCPCAGLFCSQTLALDINGVLSFLAILTKIRDDYR
jgi:hypothetical protein